MNPKTDMNKPPASDVSGPEAEATVRAGTPADEATRLAAREIRARALRAAKPTPEQMLLRHLRRMELHELGVGVRAATVLDFALERKRLTREEAVAIVERAGRDDLMVQIILISDEVLTADEVIRVARSTRRQEVQRVFDDLDDTHDPPTEN